MAELGKHRNITLFAYSEVQEVHKDPHGFTVTILKKPRYVDEKKCISCGKCSQVCILNQRIPDAYNPRFEQRSAIYTVPQAFPLTHTIDEEHCLFLKTGVCGKEPACQKACPSEAILFSQKPVACTIKVNAIVVAVGLSVYDPSPITEYGYKRYRNVITAFELERLLSASGPTGGQITMANGNKPSRVAFIQCVGSRDVAHNPYCSSICCMFATKQAMLLKERCPEIEVYLFFTDLRTSGKQSHEYLERARHEYNIVYIRSIPGEIIENPQNKKLTIEYHQGKMIKTLEVDLAVLVSTLRPNEEAKRIATLLDIALDDHGFFKTKDTAFAPLETSVPGIFVCGSCRSPASITDSVFSGSGAASKSAEWIERTNL
jgi:heterodisulfide reductase subunit A